MLASDWPHLCSAAPRNSQRSYSALVPLNIPRLFQVIPEVFWAVPVLSTNEEKTYSHTARAVTLNLSINVFYAFLKSLLKLKHINFI